MDARIGDIWSGVCCCHLGCIPMAGPIVTGATSVRSDGIITGILTSIVIGFCGHAGVVVTASDIVYAENLGKARIGDTVAGCTNGVIVTASHDVRVDGR